MNKGYLFKLLFQFSLRTLIIVLLVSTNLLAANASLNSKSSNPQSIKITGKITSELEQQGLPGVTVLEKGTQNGVITDIDGNYTIEVNDETSVLVFSYVGFETQEIAVGSMSTINVILEESIGALSEVVVTALGISREQASLGYSVGQVSGDDLTKVTQENVINSLAGKVSGVTINSTGGTGSSVSIVIRGATSLSNDNQPLFVVDGVPVINSLNNINQFGSNNIVDYGNPISDINPDDIESVSILKGPSAAALYGSRAGNGVVLITTKKGNKSEGITVNFSSNTVIDRPYKYFDTQKQFSTGLYPITPDDFPSSTTPEISPIGPGVGMETDKGYYAIQWHSPTNALGDKVPIEVVSYPDNVANFVQNGITSTNSIAVANSTELVDFRLGFTNMASRGITPNTDLFRNNFNIATSVKAHEKVRLSTNINISRSWSNNRSANGRKGNPIAWAYRVPLNINILDLDRFNEAQYAHINLPNQPAYWEPGQAGVQQRTPFNGEYNNPYFLANEINNSFVRDRIFGNVKADFQLLPELSLMARYSLDMYNENRETKMAPSFTFEPNNGSYGIIGSKNFESNADFLATYNKQINKFDYSVSVGGNISYRKGSSIRNAASPGAGLIVPEVYTVSNIKSGSLEYGSSWFEKGIYSVYGMANLSYNDMLYLDLTARNDWSSTLPVENNSYFYPSVSLSFLVNEVVDMGSKVDLFKLRGGWAQVGNDALPYQLTPVYGNAEQWGDATRLSKSGNLLTPDLKPEQATSLEFGTDLVMFNNRLRVEGTYYTMDNENQIIKNIPIASSSGFESVNINAGLVRSKGWEFMIQGTPIQTNNVRWDISVNFTRNRTTLVELTDGVDFIVFWTGAKGGSKTYVGDEIGDIYDNTLLVVEDKDSPYYGYPIVDKFLVGNSRWKDDPSRAFQTKIGNYNPDFLMGLQTSVSYKQFTLSMLFDWRKGGQFVSQTHRYMSEWKNSQDWLDQLIHPGNRTGQELSDWLVANAATHITDGFNVVGGPTPEYGGFYEEFFGVNDGVFIPGVTQNDDGTYNENLGGPGTVFMPYVNAYPWSFARSSTFDADFIKLREITLSYQFSKSLVQKLKLEDLSISLYSRNIMLWTKAGIGIDPERAFEVSAEGFKQGIENFNLEPWVFPIGFKLNLTL